MFYSPCSWLYATVLSLKVLPQLKISSATHQLIVPLWIMTSTRKISRKSEESRCWTLQRLHHRRPSWNKSKCVSITPFMLRSFHFNSACIQTDCLNWLRRLIVLFGLISTISGNDPSRRAHSRWRSTWYSISRGCSQLLEWLRSRMGLHCESLLHSLLWFCYFKIYGIVHQFHSIPTVYGCWKNYCIRITRFTPSGSSRFPFLYFLHSPFFRMATQSRPGPTVKPHRLSRSPDTSLVGLESVFFLDQIANSDSSSLQVMNNTSRSCASTIF